MNQATIHADIIMLRNRVEELIFELKETRKVAEDTRETSRSNNQTLIELVKPRLTEISAVVESHETDISRAKGALGLAMSAGAILGTIGGWIVNHYFH